MSFEELWIIVERKNPSLKKDMIRISSEQFKRAIKYAYDAGRKDSIGKDLFSMFR